MMVLARLRRLAHLFVGRLFMARTGTVHSAVQAGRYLGPVPVRMALIACSCGMVFHNDGSALASAALDAFIVPRRASARQRRPI